MADMPLLRKQVQLKRDARLAPTSQPQSLANTQNRWTRDPPLRPMLRHRPRILLLLPTTPTLVHDRLLFAQPPLAGSPRLHPSLTVWDRLVNSDLGLSNEHKSGQVLRGAPHRVRRESAEPFIATKSDEAPYPRMLIPRSNIHRLHRPQTHEARQPLFPSNLQLIVPEVFSRRSLPLERRVHRCQG